MSLKNKVSIVVTIEEPRGERVLRFFDTDNYERIRMTDEQIYELIEYLENIRSNAETAMDLDRIGMLDD